MTPPDVNLSVLAPIGFAAIGSMVILMGEVFLSRSKSFLGRPVTEAWIGSVLALVAMVFLALSIYVGWVAFLEGSSDVFNPDHPMVRLDPFASLLTSLIALGALLSCGLAITYLAELRINHGEFYALLLLSTAGMMLMVASIDLIPVFLGLELMSIPIYVLAGFDRRRLRSNESALKYFIIGSFASALLLYGMALLYGVSGTTSFEGIAASFDASNPMAIIGLGLVLVGFAFKISSVPFHQWTPDVYEGAPSVVTGFMSVTVKAAAFATLLRVLTLVFGGVEETLTNVFWLLAALTIVVGNVMAVIQDNIKRLLAYSSIAHAGYLLIGFVTGTVESYSAVLFYLIVYLFMNLGAFGVVVALAQNGQECERMESLAGLARRRPGLAAVMTLFMVSLAGIPGTAGFIAKFNLFAAAVNAGYVGLTIVAVLMSVVSVYYYLRIPVLMYMREPDQDSGAAALSSGEALVLGICAFCVLFFGIFPNSGNLQLLNWARRSVEILLGA